MLWKPVITVGLMQASKQALPVRTLLCSVSSNPGFFSGWYEGKNEKRIELKPRARDKLSGLDEPPNHSTLDVRKQSQERNQLLPEFLRAAAARCHYTMNK